MQEAVPPVPKPGKNTKRARFANDIDISPLITVHFFKKDPAEDDDFDSHHHQEERDSKDDDVDRLSNGTKTQCNLVLTRLCYSNCKKMDKVFIQEALVRLDELYDVLPKEAVRKSRTKRMKRSKELKDETCDATRLSSSVSLDTLRGLEYDFFPVAYDALHDRHIQNVLQVQNDLRQRRDPRSSSEVLDFDNTLRKASIKTSRPLRRMAFRLAKYDTKQAFKAVFSKWTL